MKKIYYTAIPIVLAIQTQAQNITLDNLEATFLQKNYALIANKFNVDRIDAEIIQLRNQLDKAREIKQSMMQELLTGRIRLI